MARRLVVVRAVMTALFAAIILRLVQLQVLEGARNRRLANENRIRVIRRHAPRGNIRDRDGHILAGSRPSFSVAVVPGELQAGDGSDPMGLLARLLRIPLAEVQARLAAGRSRPYEPVGIWRDAAADAVARLEENAVYLSGVNVLPEAVRHYPCGRLAAHVLGYVREIGPEELARPDNADYRPGDLIGKEGVEKTAESALRGVDGGDQVEVDARGRRVRTLGVAVPRAGRDVWLTLDLELQRAAEAALGDRKGAVVAMEPNTGEVLALASHPSYDPDLFADRLTAREWRRISGPGHPQYNRATASRVPPASLFKVITAAAALEARECDSSSRFYCPGTLSLGKWQLHCWKQDGHGSLSFLEGFAQSCNVMFAILGRRVGPEKLAEMARRFGLGEKTGLDLTQEDAGLVPTPEWKRLRGRGQWYAGDTCQMAIGQGDCLVTPVQVAREFAVVANGGYLVQPHIIRKIEGEPARSYAKQEVGLRPDTIRLLQAGAEAVVAEGGTAHMIASSRYRIAGKTGTAENPGGATHAWFAGYAPAEDPAVVVVVLVEHGGKGAAAAAPIARQIFDAALLRPAKRPPPG
jgi:penicillin-binding protein 2